MNELRLLKEIRNDFVSKFDNDPQVKRICNIIINEFKARSKALTLTDVVKPSLCELYDFGKQNKACEKKCNSCKWMEEQ